MRHFLPIEWTCATIGLVMIVSGRPARADGPASTQPSVDKWQYTLFNPTPDNLLRDMDTDRPNLTNTPHTIDAGHLQVETGIFQDDYDRDRYQGADERIESLDLGAFNFRLGVLNDLELNAVVNTWDFQTETDKSARTSVRQNGVGDTVVGGKLNFWGDDGEDSTWATALAIQPQFKIPTAREDLGNGHAELFVGFPFLMNLPDGFHLGLQTTPSWERNAEDTGDVAGLQNSVSVDRVFFRNVDIYLEYWADVSTEHHQEAEQTMDVGFTYPLNDNLVLDTGVNLGLNRATDNVQWLTGISVRF